MFAELRELFLRTADDDQWGMGLVCGEHLIPALFATHRQHSTALAHMYHQAAHVTRADNVNVKVAQCEARVKARIEEQARQHRTNVLAIDMECSLHGLCNLLRTSISIQVSWDALRLMGVAGLLTLPLCVCALRRGDGGMG